MKHYPVHRSLVAVDIEGYSLRRNQDHLELRAALRRVLADAFDAAGVEIAPSEQQDQGDAFLTLVRSEISKVVLVDGFVREIENALRRYNHYHTEEGKMRLRVAIHAGEVHLDGTGFPGEATVTVMRLIEAEQVKGALASAPKDLAVIISDSLYRDIVAHDYGGIVHDEYSQVDVVVKKFRGVAWIRVPGRAAVGDQRSTTAVTPPGAPPDDSGMEQRTGQSSVPPAWFSNAHFSGPTSFGGYAAGHDININERRGGRT